MKHPTKTKIVRMSGSMFIAAAIMMTGLFACQDDTPDSSNSEAVWEETTFAENVFNGITLEVEEGITLPFVPNGRFIGRFGKLRCASRTVEAPEGEEYPIVVTLDYGDGCTSWNETTFQGKIVTTISGPRDEVGTEIVTTFEEFYVNEHKIEGTQRRVVVSETVITSTLENGSITTPEGEIFSRTSTRTREIISGLDTENRSDDVFQITGSSSGVTPEGIEYRKTITDPLVSSRDCRWITSGTIESVVDGVTRVTDFGDGECDNLATQTVDGITEEITMDFRIKRKKLHRR
ncbi:MAG: hypothetical protein AAF632_03360 [Bacteroidota bacterium]